MCFSRHLGSVARQRVNLQTAVSITSALMAVEGPFNTSAHLAIDESVKIVADQQFQLSRPLRQLPAKRPQPLFQLAPAAVLQVANSHGEAAKALSNKASRATSRSPKAQFP